MKATSHLVTSTAIMLSVWLGLAATPVASATDLSKLKLFGKWTETHHASNLGDVHGSIALSSKWAVAGAWGAADRGADNEGGVLVFNAATGALVRKILPPGAPTADQFFGYAVAVSGDTLVVGAHGSDSGRGKAHVYNLAKGTFTRTLPNTSTSAVNDFFGSAVAVGGNFIAVGSYGADGSGVDKGKVDVFSASSGALLYSITADDGASNDLFGTSLAIEGDILAVGAPGHSANRGKVYFYWLKWFEFDRMPAIEPAGSVAGDFVGACLAMHQGRVAIGSNFRGKAFLYNLATGYQHSLLPVIPAGDGSFGNSVAINHEFIAVGQRFADGDNGSVHLFNLSGFEEDSFTSVGSSPGKFGASVCFEGSTLLATAPEESSYSSVHGVAILFKPFTGPMKGLKLAGKGDSAPGASGINYGNLGDGFVDSLGGTVAFMSGLTGPAALSTDTASFLWTGPVEPRLLTRSRADYPGSPGVKYGRITNLACNASGHTLSFASLSGPGVTSANNKVILVDGSALARTGESSILIGGTPSSFPELVGPAVSGPDRYGCAFTLKQLVGGATATSDSGVLIDDLSASSATVKEGDAAPASLVGVYYGQFTPRLCYTKSSQFFSSAIVGTGVLPTNNTGVFGRTLAGAQSVVARKGDQAVDAAGNVLPLVRYSTFIGEASNALNTAIYRATLSGPTTDVTPANNEGLWAFDATVPVRRLLLRKDQLIPDLFYLKVDRIINFWGSADLASVEQALVLVRLKGQGINSTNDQALLLAQSDGSVRLLMRENDVAPGCPGAKIGTITRVQVDFENHTYAILATLTGAPAGTELALFTGKTDRGDNTNGFALRRPFLRLRKGKMFDNQPSKITSISLPTSNIAASGAGSIGRGRSVSAAVFAVNVTFQNGVQQMMLHDLD